MSFVIHRHVLPQSGMHNIELPPDAKPLSVGWRFVPENIKMMNAPMEQAWELSLWTVHMTDFEPSEKVSKRFLVVPTGAEMTGVPDLMNFVGTAVCNELGLAMHIFEAY